MATMNTSNLYTASIDLLKISRTRRTPEAAPTVAAREWKSREPNAVIPDS